MVLLPPFLLFCGLPERIVSRAQVACSDRVREAQSINECLMPDLRYAQTQLLYFDCAILARPVLL